MPEGLRKLERLSDEMSRLSAEVRMTLVLVVMQGRTVAQAADLLSVSEEGCRYFLSHGRKSLMRALQRELSGAPEEQQSALLEDKEGPLYDLRRGKKATARA